MMNLTKRIFCAILAMLLLLGSVPAVGFAAEQSPEEAVVPTAPAADPAVHEHLPLESGTEVPCEVPSAVWIDPMYEGVITEADLPAREAPAISVFATPRYHTTYAEAAAELKEYVKERITNVTIGYMIPISDYTNEGFSKTVNGILDIVYKHTGVPDEGDYISGSNPAWGGKAPFKGYCSCGNHYYCYFELQFYYMTTTEQERIMDSHVASLMRSLNPTGTDYQKVRKIYDWICNNIDFDYEHLEDKNYRIKHSAYAALVDRQAVCSGFGMLLYRLALEAGVDCRYIVGNEGTHAWNIIRIGDRYYNLDASWDTELTPSTYRYFLRNDDTFYDHYRNPEYKTKSFYASYPMGKYTYDPNAKVVITRQPSNVWAYEGDIAHTSFNATGKDLTYTWYFANAGATKFTKTNTFTGNYYQTVMDDARDGRRIYCLVKDAYGNSQKTNTVTLEMVKNLTLLRQPVSTSAYEGDVAAVTVSAQGNGLSYAWYYADAGSDVFLLTNSYKTNKYSVEMTPARAGRRIYCVISDRFGHQVQTNTVTLSMKTRLAITAQPVSVTAESGAVAKVSFRAVGEGLRYDWYFKNKGASSFSYTGTYKGNSYSAKMDGTRDGRQVYCIVTDEDGNSIRTDTVTLSLKRPLKLLVQPASVKAHKGDTVALKIDATGDGLKYAWYYKNKGDSAFSLSTAVTGSTYSVKMDESRNGREIYCRITDAYGNSVQTKTVTISMYTPLVITGQPSSVTVKSGEQALVKVSASGDGLKYKWYYANSGSAKFTLTTAFTGNTYKVNMDGTRDGRRLYCVITDAYGKSVQTNTVTISMNTGLKIQEQPRSVTVSKGATARTEVSAVGDGLTYRWYFANAGSDVFRHTASFSGNAYYVKMDAERNGRRVYCVITDRYGKSVTTDVVTLKMK